MRKIAYQRIKSAAVNLALYAFALAIIFSAIYAIFRFPTIALGWVIFSIAFTILRAYRTRNRT